MDTSALQTPDTRLTGSGTTDVGTADIEELLEAAGIDFCVVERCPLPGCDVCDHREIPAAA